MQYIRFPNDADIAILGAGVAGLTAAKCLLAHGFEPTIYEQTSELGGIWRYDEYLTDGSRPAYRSLRTNTSKQMMAFSDFLFPEKAPDFLPRTDVLAYLNAYADQFNVREHIRFDTTVNTVERTTDGRWLITLTTDGDTQQHTFDAVLVCTGHYREPRMVRFPGSDAFKGTLLHSSSYKHPEEYEGQHVVVVGAGSSAADIAVELANVTANVSLSVRHGAWFLPHYIRGRPWDHHQSRLSLALPRRIRDYVFRRLLFTEYQRIGIDFASHPLNFHNLTFDLRNARFTPSTPLLHRVAVEDIEVVPAIERFETRSVRFANGVRRPADAVILATGYRWSLPFLNEPFVHTPSGRPRLYNHVFHPEYPTLAFVGICTINGPTPPVVEMQARWIARVLSGAIGLPAGDAMHDTIEKRWQAAKRLKRDPMQVQALEYMDEIAGLIGVRPRLSRHLNLAKPLLIGPMIPTQFRLDGPNNWEHAESVIRQEVQGHHEVGRDR